MRLYASFIYAAGFAFATTLLALQSALPEGDSRWYSKPPATIVAAILVGVATAVQAWHARQIKVRHGLTREEMAETILRRLSFDLAESPIITVPIQFHSFQAWAVSPIYRKIFSFRLRRSLRKYLLPKARKHIPRARLTRLARVRMRDNANDGIQWGKGKGAIGRCVETSASPHPKLYDLTELWRAISSDISAEAWNDLASNVRLGLEVDEFKKVRQRYSAIMVCPVIGDDGDSLGCVSIEIPWDKTEPGLGHQSIANLVAGAAQQLHSVF